ncbi:MAG TPA: hypothetical protein DCP90_05865 [Clostridiales bacterium]|nr:MAG: hypothetical protein A2Y22_09435 [Clostridiales bacterium GWD2_32_59]HAN10120.1 hypothetical protein [Clostridiales bacterium]
MKKFKILRSLYVALFFTIFISQVVFAEVSTAPMPEDIVSYAGLANEPDSITISNLSSRTIIKVYTTQTGGSPIAVEANIDKSRMIFLDRQRIIESEESLILEGVEIDESLILDGAEIDGELIPREAEFDDSVTIYFNQLGKLGTKLYVSITSIGKTESLRTLVSAKPETVALSPAIRTIHIENYPTEWPDIISVEKPVDDSIMEGDIIRVYSTATSTTPIGIAKMGEFGAVVIVNQLGISAGKIYVTSAYKDNKSHESSRTEVNFYGEPTTQTPLVANIIVTNNINGTSDKVEVNGLYPGDIVSVFTVSKGGAAIGTAIVEEDARTVTISIPQLGAIAGKIYVSVKSDRELESARTEKLYSAELVSTPPAPTAITVANNFKGTNDNIEVTGLEEGDVIKLYTVSKAGIVIGTATVGVEETSANISIVQLGTAAGTLYVSVTSTNKLESIRTAKTYTTEPTTTELASSRITVKNNIAGTNDTVDVTGLAEGDVVKVYNVLSGGGVIGTATVGEGETSVNIVIAQIGIEAKNIFVSITSTGKMESKRTSKAYESEISITPAATVIAVTNNYTGNDDTVAVTGLVEGDTVKVYNVAIGGVAIGTATVGSGLTSATVAIPQIGTGTGSIYVTVTSINKLESKRTAKIYIIEPTSTAPVATAITVTNNYIGTDDKVTVTGLIEGDIVKVYSATTGGVLLGSEIVSSGETSATVTISQIGAGTGPLYVSVTSQNKLESKRIAKTYTTEPASTVPLITAITVTNNYAGTDDTVVVTGLVEGDTIKVYNVSTGGTAIGTATVGVGETSKAVEIAQLGASTGTIYITLTNTNKLESKRIAKAYATEPTTTAPMGITVKNNATGTNDTVVVTDLIEGDIVKVYSVAREGTAIGTRVVGEGETSATVTISQIGSGVGSVYVSVTSPNKLESKRTIKAYTSEISVAPIALNIIAINNNTGVNDAVIVAGLAEGDVVKVYSALVGETYIGTATVGTGSTSASVAITQLGTTSGTVYISVTNPNKFESKRTPKMFNAAL